MATQTSPVAVETVSTGADKAKLAAAGLLVVGAVVVFYLLGQKDLWPTRKEALQMTGYVFAFVVVMALFLWITDKTLEWVLYDLVLGWKR